MTMQSTALLPELGELPVGEQGPQGSFREHITGLVNTDRAMYAAEFASGVSFGMWAVFDNTNVDDTLAKAFEAQYPRLASDHSLHDQWQEMMDRGPESMEGFISGLKGKVAEFNVAENLEQNGFNNVEIAADPTQPVWDIRAVSPEGEDVLIQVKTGGTDYTNNIQDLVSENPDIQYAVSTEIYDFIFDPDPELTDQLIDIGPDFLLVEGINDGLNTLSSNLGIDIPRTASLTSSPTLPQSWQAPA